MNRKIILGIAYVSFFVVLWGSVGSIIDYPLLNADIYQPGSIGQYITFSFTGALTFIVGYFLYPKFINAKLVSSFLDS